MNNNSTMKLKLTRPICGIDVETTGLDKTNDRIIQISITKIQPSGEIYKVTKLINPQGVKSSPEAFAKHGITDEELESEEPFYRYANNIYKLIKDCDFLMYNGLDFDVAFIDEEFLRCGLSIDWDFKIVDPHKILSKYEPRTLEWSYNYYCNKTSENLHSADEDVAVTIEILDAQIEKYGIEPTVEELCTKRECLDLGNVIKIAENGDYVWAIGKHKGKSIFFDVSYCQWVLDGNFCRNTKNHLIKLLIAAGLYDQIKQN